MQVLPNARSVSGHLLMQGRPGGIDSQDKCLTAPLLLDDSHGLKCSFERECDANKGLIGVAFARKLHKWSH